MSTSDQEKTWMVSWDSDSDSDSVVGFEKIRIRKNSDSFYPYYKPCGRNFGMEINFVQFWIIRKLRN